MKAFVFVAVAILACAHAQTIDECLEKDSITCVQESLFRTARSFFNKDSIDIGFGLSLDKKESGRSARTSEDIVKVQEISSTKDVAAKQNLIEDFVGEQVSNFAQGRSLRIHFGEIVGKVAETARAFTQSMPVEIEEAARAVEEGRGKKKILKKILPLLLLAKAKIGALAVLGYFAIALIAKKAIIASLISIAISAFIGLKSLWSKSSHDTTSYSNGWANTASAGWAQPASTGGWSSVGGASSGGWDDSSSYNAHNQAFSGYHRR